MDGSKRCCERPEDYRWTCILHLCRVSQGREVLTSIRRPAIVSSTGHVKGSPLTPQVPTADEAFVICLEATLQMREHHD